MDSRTLDPVDESLAESIEASDAPGVLRWAAETFGDRIALATSFSAEDMVVLDLMAQIWPRPRVFTLDTGRLPEETYAVLDETRERYDVDLEVFFPDADRVERMVREHGVNLFYRSVDLRKLCCQVRKVEPLRRALAPLDGWICGLRREQSVTRQGLRKLETDTAHGNIVKLAPLADWTSAQVWEYVKAHDLPYNKLHDRGFPSIGCAPCTRAVAEGEDERAGRWWWESPEQKECGLHVGPHKSAG
jgi:phosphoadenosine phosphosulfate reductase